MTINSTTRSISYEGNGTVSSFDFAFKVFQSSDLYVVSLNESTGVETTLVLNTNYTVALNADQNYSPGGTITITAGAPASGTRITITSTIANLQPTDLSNQGGFYPDVINNSLDRACIQIQQVNSAISRQLVAPVSDGTTTTLTLPTKENRASKYLAFDASGAPTASSGTVNPVVSAGASVTLQPNNAGSNVGRDVIVQDYNTEYARFVGSSQYLGLGIAAPQQRLHVNGSAASVVGMQITNGATSGTTALDGIALRLDASANAYLWNYENTFFSFGTNALERVRIDSSGNVGVGTASPASLFHAHNTASADTQIRLTNGATGATASDGVAMRLDSTGVAYLWNYEASSLLFGTSASERMKIDASGNVGIGTTPTSTLDVFGGQIRMRAAGTYSDPASNCGTLYYDTTGGTFTIDSRSNVGSTLMSFRTSNGGVGAERMRIESDGRIGIGGATTANTRFVVKGQSTISTDNTIVVTDSAGAVMFAVANDGNFNTGLKSASPYNNTTATAANCVIGTSGTLVRSTSSLKYKTDVHDATHGLADAMKLRSVTYKGKNDGDTIFGGLIAEEVHAAGLTEFVQYAADGTPDALAYGNMVALAFKSIQELKAIIDAQATRIAALEAR